MPREALEHGSAGGAPADSIGAIVAPDADAAAPFTRRTARPVALSRGHWQPEPESCNHGAQERRRGPMAATVKITAEDRECCQHGQKK